MLDNLKKYHLLLASNSPRRRELLSQLRIPFNVINLGGIDESYPDSLPREEVAQYIERIDEMIGRKETLFGRNR